MFRGVTALLALLIGATYSMAQPYNMNSDSLMRRIEIMSTENPGEAQATTLILVEKAKQTSNGVLRIKSLVALSKVSQPLGLSTNALAYIDTAIALAHNMGNINMEADALLERLKLCQIINDQPQRDKTLRSLDKALKSKEFAPLHIRQLLIEGDYYKQKSDFKKAVQLKEQALKEATIAGNDSIITECYQNLGSTFWFFGDYRLALQHYSSALSIKEKQPKDKESSFSIHRNIGLAYRSLGQYDKSHEHLTMALEQASGMGSNIEKANILNLLGGLKLNSNKLDEALEDFESSYAIYESEKMLKSSVAVLQNIARTYAKKSSFNTALQYMDEALSIQSSLMDPLSESAILNEIGNIKLQQDEIPEALWYYLMSLTIRNNYDDKTLVAKSLINIGIAYRKLGMYNNATKHLEHAIELAKEGYVKPIDATYVLQNLAHVYNDQAKYSKAIEKYQDALSIAESLGDETQMCRLLCNIAQVQINATQHGAARSTLTQALKISIKKSSQNDMANIYNELGNVERSVSNPLQAIVYFNKAADIYRKNQNSNGYALCMRKIGEAQTDLENYTEAEQRIKESIGIGQSNGNAHLLLYGYQAMYKLLDKKGSYRSALEYHIKYTGIKDSLNSNKSNERSIEAQIDLATYQITKEIKLKEAEMEAMRNKAELDKEKIARQSAVRNFLIVIVVLVVVLAVLATMSLQQKRKYARNLEEKIIEINLVNDKLTRSEKELKETIKLKDKLFSIVAHDLRNPFTALLGLTEVMSEQAEHITHEEMVSFSKHINTSARSVLTLIENLLHWARSQTGRLLLKPTIYSMSAIIGDVIETANLAASEKGIAIHTDIGKDTDVLVDVDTITVAIRNLVSNAIKYTPNGGAIRLSVEKIATEVKVVIADTGVGIPPENLKKLFSIDGVTTKGTNNESGTGLGLLTSKDFVEKNQGTMVVESTVNKGTIFIITLKSS